MKKVNYVVDADIKCFFDHVDHEGMMKFLKLRISDSKILDLIIRFLKAGILEKANLFLNKIKNKNTKSVQNIIISIELGLEIKYKT